MGTPNSTLFSFLGFTVSILPFTYVVGFENDSVMLKTMNAAFYLICIYVYAMFKGLQDHPLFVPFRPGILLLGGIVYFIGCLIISNKYYSWQHQNHTIRYIWCNSVAIGSGLVALGLGSTLPSLGYLKGLGGTFFILLVIEKWFEVPWGRKGWAWAVTGFGVSLYLLVQWTHQYPEYLL